MDSPLFSSMAAQLGVMWTFPRWSERLWCTCACKTLPLGGNPHVTAGPYVLKEDDEAALILMAKVARNYRRW